MATNTTTSSTPAATSAPLSTIADFQAAYVQPYQNYVNQASADLNTGFSNVLTATQNAANAANTSDVNMANNLLNKQLPLVQQSYANLQQELSQEQKNETSATQEASNYAAQQGTYNIQSAQAALAQSGAENAQGRFSSSVSQAQSAAQNTNDQYALKLQNIADTYGVKQQDIVNQMNQSVEALTEQAAQYQAQGQQALAQSSLQIAQLNYNQNQQIQNLAMQMNTVATQQAQAAYTDYINSVKLDQANQRLTIMDNHYKAMENAANTRNQIEADRLVNSQNSSQQSDMKTQLSNMVTTAIQQIANNTKNKNIDGTKTRVAKPWATENAAKQIQQELAQAYIPKLSGTPTAQQLADANIPTLEQIQSALYTERNKSIYKGIKF